MFSNKHIKPICTSTLIALILSSTALVASPAFAEDSDDDTTELLMVAAAATIKGEHEKIDKALNSIHEIVNSEDVKTYYLGVSLINTIYLTYELSKLEFSVGMSSFEDLAKTLSGMDTGEKLSKMYSDIDQYEYILYLRLIQLGKYDIECRKEGQTKTVEQAKACIQKKNNTELKKRDVELNIVRLAFKLDKKGSSTTDISGELLQKATGLSFGENRYYRLGLNPNDIDAFLSFDYDERRSFEKTLDSDNSGGQAIISFIYDHTVKDSPLRVLANRNWKGKLLKL